MTRSCLEGYKDVELKKIGSGFTGAPLLAPGEKNLSKDIIFRTLSVYEVPIREDPA